MSFLRLASSEENIPYYPENALVNAFVTSLDQSAIDQFNMQMDRNITFSTLEFAMKTALEIDMQARTHFNGSSDVSPATAQAFVAEEPASSKSRASRRPRDPPSGKDEPAPSKSRASRRPRDPPSGKSDASPVPQRSDEYKNAAERYVKGIHCPFCWRSKNRAYKHKLSECKSRLKQHESAYLAYTSRELCFAVDYDICSEHSDTSPAVSVFDGEPITTDRVSSLSTNQPPRQPRAYLSSLHS